MSTPLPTRASRRLAAQNGSSAAPGQVVSGPAVQGAAVQDAALPGPLIDQSQPAESSAENNEAGSNKRRSTVLITLLCALLGFAIVLQVRQTTTDQLSTLRQDDLIRLLEDVTVRSEQLEAEVVRLSEILAGYFGKFYVNIIPFTDIQLAIRDNCDQEYLTIVMRRVMMYIADIIAGRTSSQALVTGESMGQVASQTIQSLAVTDCAASIPIFRPLIGMDKMEVVDAARKIGTYDTSILPYEDCCTVFTPKHPKTRPKLDDTLSQEARIGGLSELIKIAADKNERLIIRPDW